MPKPSEIQPLSAETRDPTLNRARGCMVAGLIGAATLLVGSMAYEANAYLQTPAGADVMAHIEMFSVCLKVAIPTLIGFSIFWIMGDAIENKFKQRK